MFSNELVCNLLDYINKNESVKRYLKIIIEDHESEDELKKLAKEAINLLDTVDKSCSVQFFENLSAVLKDRKLDYIIVQHMEPDHCALLKQVVDCYPDVKIVCTAKALGLIKQFFEKDGSYYEY